MHNITIQVEGISCGHCVNSVEEQCYGVVYRGVIERWLHSFTHLYTLEGY
jgi:hypothetical protein